ncbi:carbon-nitrogen hydrolase family protein [Nonomuraea purpurea]|uniref:Carbon-nitrogen hydrolase family protein n=1 Tax=Nonomuraea purpurea TaxID=1849276 RepID=A0ABV8GKJ1_9ACTN
MKISIAVAQIPITWDIAQDLPTIAAVLADAQPDEIVVLPEGALSGYGSDLSVLSRLDPTTLAHAIDDLTTLVREKAVHLADGPLTVGVQICREIRFPEQWQYLANAGAQAFIYLTHAANLTEPAGVWRSHLISRAAENQRFVLAANVADPHQHCPSMIISPRGESLAELPANSTDRLRATIDTDEASDWYLDQRRRDIVHLRYQNRPAE